MDFLWEQFEKFTDMYDNRFRLSEYLLHDYVMFMHGFWRKWIDSDILCFRDALLYCFLFISGFYFSFKRMFQVRKVFLMTSGNDCDFYLCSRCTRRPNVDKPLSSPRTSASFGPSVSSSRRSSSWRCITRSSSIPSSSGKRDNCFRSLAIPFSSKFVI